MKLSSRSLKQAALICAGLAAAALLFLWLALPRIIQSQAERFVAARTGHRLVLDRPEFNPFRLALRLGKLRLDDPAGQPLLAFDGLLIDLAAASIFQRALVFDAIRLDNPQATVIELPGGTLNWTPFLDALKGREAPATAQSGLPRFDIRAFALAGGRIDYTDRRRTDGFTTRIEPLDLTLTDISTLPGEDGKFRLAALASPGARIEIDGAARLDPLSISGSFSLADLQLAGFAPYLKQVFPEAPAGTAALTARYRVGNDGGRLDALVEGVEARLTGLRLALKAPAGAVATVDAIELKAGRFQWAEQQLAIGAIQVNGGQLDLPRIARPPRFGALSVEDINVALAARKASVGKVTFADGRVQVERKADGGIDLLAALQAPGFVKSPPAAATAETAPPWRFSVAQVAVANLGMVLRDAGVVPAAELALERFMLQADGIGDDLQAPVSLRMSFDVRGGGRFEGDGQVVPGAPAADLRFKLADLDLRLAQPYLAAQTTLRLAGGKLAAQGRVRHGAVRGKGTQADGEFVLRDLRLMEPGADKPLLAWKTFGSRAVKLSEGALDLGELRLNGLDTRLLIDKDKNLNFKRILKSAGPPAQASAAAAPAPARDAPAFAVNIDRLRFRGGELDFADHSLLLPFGTRIHHLRGSIAGLSNRSGAAGQIELDGEVDDFGMARAVGQVDLFNPTDALDLRVQFRNVEMTRLTPYTATFAGRKIASGKLSLDLQYRIKQRQLQGDNQIVMDKLALGERVDSPDAANLPLDLAIAILQDADGRIDLGLPVAGSLDDPSFSYGAIVWKAITNVLTKIVTAPFRALGALFGGGEQLDSIAFEAGAPQLAPPEREKLGRVAAALAKRPGLALTVGGLWAEADRLALQELQLRRAVLAAAGQRVPEQGDPGPLSTRQPKIQSALEALFKERIGASDLDALKAGFRKANPGQLEESMTGRMLSRLSGLLREKKTLSDSEVERLRGADFHGVLFERLRMGETVPDARLQALAQRRGEAALAALKDAGVAAERLQARPPEKAGAEEAGGGDVPLRLVLEPLGAK
ncbi:MAG: DUF748 domain-containing protein [Pseudomonadota bacterium]